MEYQTLVIGAGLSGLSAGIRAAMFGRRVAVLESHSLWGGLNSFYKRKGRLFDTGLHALTNCGERGAKGTPLGRLLRQLRIAPDRLELLPQHHSEVVLGDLRLCFSNDPALWMEEVARAFPAQADRFAALHRELGAMNIDQVEGPERSAKSILVDRLGPGPLVDVLRMAPTYYTSARSSDVDWDQFCVLYRAIFHEGLALPRGGIRPFLKLFVERLREEGGELRTHARVAEILRDGNAVRGVRLESGEELHAEQVLSSAGWVETMALVGPDASAAHVRPEQRASITVFETISVLNRPAISLAPRPLTAATVFFAPADGFDYRAPDGFVSANHGVLSIPENFGPKDAHPGGEWVLRTTLLAHPSAWHGLDEEQYRAEKQRSSELALDRVSALYGDPRPAEIYRDSFTPRTITKYTGHDRGALYGSPHKRRDGTTPYGNLFLIGADQGWCGIVGAGLSGIAMTNRHVLGAGVGG